jgi:hypothetical protein
MFNLESSVGQAKVYGCGGVGYDYMDVGGRAMQGAIAEA